MIQSYINTVTPLASNTASVAFQTDCIRTNSSRGCNGWLCHSQGSPTYTITEGGYYDISFHGSVSSVTAGIVAFALFNNGEMIPRNING